MEMDIIRKYFNQNIHFMKISIRYKSFKYHKKCDSFEGDESDLRYELEWRYSHRSAGNIFTCMSADSSEPIDETTLSKTDQSLVIITDEPGMGKTSTLQRLSRKIESAWVIYIELKQFKVHIDSLPDEHTPQSIAKFLLGENCSSSEDSMAHGLLKYLLQSKINSKRVVLMLDGYDELDDYVEGKESAKEKIVRLLISLKNIPTVQIFMTTRKYLKESLEKKLLNVSTSFLPINEEDQLSFLDVFWRSCLSLELADCGEIEDGRLKEYGREVLLEAKRLLGPEMDSFMGVPLQLRMLAEVFRPQTNLLLQSPEILLKQINIVSGPNLYKKFIDLKYEIYLQEKTTKGEVLDEDEILKYLEFVTKTHGELAFRTLFPDFYDANFDAIEDKWLHKLNRHGLVQSMGNGESQFVHRTYAEYCCAQMIIHLLNQRSNFPRYELFKEILLPQILLHSDSKVIRLFMNVQLKERQVLKQPLELNAKCINRLWLEDSAIFRKKDHQTALHIAVQEKNEYIVAFLFSGLNIESTQTSFVSYITQYDLDNNTALNMVAEPELHNISEDNFALDEKIIFILQLLESCSDETKEKIFFASLFNHTISKSDEAKEKLSFAYLLNRDFSKSEDNEEKLFFIRLFNRNYSNYHSFYHNNLFTSNATKEKLIFINSFYRDIRKYISCSSKIFNRLRAVELQIKPFIKAIKTNNLKLAKKILSKQLNDNIERYCLLLIKHNDHEMQTALHIAAKMGHLDMVKLLKKQTAVPFAILMEQWDEDKMTPLHTAASYGHLIIVKYFVKYGADINARSERGRSALMFAAISGDLQIAKYLVESGADINAIDDTDNFALYWAATEGHLPVVKYLLLQGADPHKVTWNGGTVLAEVSWWRGWYVVRLLLEREVDVNAGGGKALLYAIKWEEWSIVEALIDKGAAVKETQITENLNEFLEKYPNYEFKDE